MSQVSLGRPEFVPGTPPGHPDRQIPLCDFSLSVFFLPLGLLRTPGRQDMRMIGFIVIGFRCAPLCGCPADGWRHL